ncbi:hypothetical protein D3C72_1964660 [compost metagenome]
MALRGKAQASADLAPVPRQLVVAPYPQHVFGRPGAEGLAFVLRVVQVFGGVVGVAGKQLQAAEYLAADLGLDALAAHLAGSGGAVPVVAGKA